MFLQIKIARPYYYSEFLKESNVGFSKFPLWAAVLRTASGMLTYTLCFLVVLLSGDHYCVIYIASHYCTRED
jgi:hypothetical protein